MSERLTPELTFRADEFGSDEDRKKGFDSDVESQDSVEKGVFQSDRIEDADWYLSPDHHLEEDS